MKLVIFKCSTRDPFFQKLAVYELQTCLAVIFKMGWFYLFKTFKHHPSHCGKIYIADCVCGCVYFKRMFIRTKDGVLFSISSTFYGCTSVLEMFCKGWAQVMLCLWVYLIIQPPLSSAIWV